MDNNNTLILFEDIQAKDSMNEVENAQFPAGGYVCPGDSGEV